MGTTAVAAKAIFGRERHRDSHTYRPASKQNAKLLGRMLTPKPAKHPARVQTRRRLGFSLARTKNSSARLNSELARSVLPQCLAGNAPGGRTERVHHCQQPCRFAVGQFPRKRQKSDDRTRRNQRRADFLEHPGEQHDAIYWHVPKVQEDEWAVQRREQERQRDGERGIVVPILSAPEPCA